MKIGFMQGRLSPLVNNKIQAFPYENWKTEFSEADRLGIRAMEWTLDQHNLHSNPLMTDFGRAEIGSLSSKFNVEVPSVTGDCFMQSPFWKIEGRQSLQLQADLKSVIYSCSKMGISKLVVPLVDNGSIETDAQRLKLLDFSKTLLPSLKRSKIQIVFESDFAPEKLKEFIDDFDTSFFGVNYDIGNSAALGFDVEKEFDAYGHRVRNVHIKDRIYNGNTVPLGLGCADFDKMFGKLKEFQYDGNLILQTARATDGNHSIVLKKYSRMVAKWKSVHGL